MPILKRGAPIDYNLKEFYYRLSEYMMTKEEIARLRLLFEERVRQLPSEFPHLELAIVAQTGIPVDCPHKIISKTQPESNFETYIDNNDEIIFSLAGERVSFFGYGTPEDNIKASFDFLTTWLRGDIRTRTYPTFFCSRKTEFEMKTGAQWTRVYTASTGRASIFWGLLLIAVLGWLAWLAGKI